MGFCLNFFLPGMENQRVRRMRGFFKGGFWGLRLGYWGLGAASSGEFGIFPAWASSAVITPDSNFRGISVPACPALSRLLRGVVRWPKDVAGAGILLWFHCQKAEISGFLRRKGTTPEVKLPWGEFRQSFSRAGPLGRKQRGKGGETRVRAFVPCVQTIKNTWRV